ncbi:hypothetical protein KUTeg_024558 [Tegillarca granosa]|uniref:Uncharacterized protein n=1 Tax=Tegillarca granosa TaxID=220873 RepID=A0ABQ9DYE5_TEGGR|nr:hypothetical protein KUTeg_024558 [Tegillarca granosa]
MVMAIFISYDTSYGEDPERVKGKIEASAEMADKLTKVKGRFTQKTNKGRQLPTADEAKRIAKIFSQKYT